MALQKMNFESRTVSINEIDTQDSRYQLSLHIDTHTIIESIKAVGLINPPVIVKRDDDHYSIVCGFRRVMACKALGWDEIPVCIPPRRPTDLDCLKLAILDNRSHRPLNLIEQSRAIKKLSPFFPPQERFSKITFLLGLPENEKVFKKIESLCQLSESAKLGILENTLSLEAGVELVELEPEEQDCFAFLFRTLKFSQNKQKELITFVKEIAIRESVGIKEVINSEEIRGIIDRSDINRNQKAKEIRAYLRRRRFPSLTKAEAKFFEDLKSLRLGPHIRLVPPPYFEGTTYNITITFKDITELEQCKSEFDAMCQNPVLKRILS